MVPTLPAAVPRRGGSLTRTVGRVALVVLRWRVAGEIPDRPKFVIIAAPHRSNWDLVIGLATKLALGLDVTWLGKHTIFRGPFDAMFRWFGGVPVDRRSANDTVASVVERFASRDRMVLGLAPEGTRKVGAPWKSGFWHIARGARVPILPVAFDWETRTVRILEPIEPVDAEADIARLKATYASFRGPRA